MYASYFGFKENPFNLTPDPRYLFLSSFHKEALDHLLYGINERKGFIAVTGGVGTGKTTLCRALFDHLDSSTKSALIFNTFMSDMELLENISQEYGIEMQSNGGTSKKYLQGLNQFLLENFSQGGNAVVLIDEAQNLSHEVLEQIRMLSNLETEREKLIQIVLVGQTELKQLLSSPSLRQLNDRIIVRYDLKPLTRNDIQGYIEHRLVVAGGRGELKFTKGAYKKIYLFSEGIPRRINAVCDRALLVAYTTETSTISKDIVERAVSEIRGNDLAVVKRSDGSPMRFALSTLLLLILILVAGYAGWNFRWHSFLVSDPVKTERAPALQTKVMQPIVIKPVKKAVDLFLDDEASIAGLFNLFRKKESRLFPNRGDGFSLGLFTLRLKAEYFVMFKKPFRVRLARPDQSHKRPDQYLLISQVNGNGAKALDAEGRERAVTRSFILKHWGEEVTWVYPFKNRNLYLSEGMSDPEILELQKILNKIGYLTEATGTYDESTVYGVRKLQKDFDLDRDGIVGPQTKALLFQMLE